MLEGFVDKVVQIVTNDGRNIVGLLKGFDQTTNVILDECHERVFSSSAGVEQVRARSSEKNREPRPSHTVGVLVGCAGRPRALHCARRQHVRRRPPRAMLWPRHCPDHSRARCPPLRSALVGEIDEEADAELALDEIVAEPLKPVVH